MNEILETLVRLMAPVLSFTADEIWQYMGAKTASPVFMRIFCAAQEKSS
jgi:isoleucyl-tRNA synthetase